MKAPTPPDAAKPYEQRDVALRPIVVAGLALTAVVVATFVIVAVLSSSLASRESARSAPASPLAGYAPQEPPAPRLQQSPRRDLDALRAREGALLDTYGWVDRGAGRVRIPVERAMRLLAEDGRP